MNEFITSLKADLTDRRLLPLVALVGVCLIAAIAYAVLGGSSGSSAGSTPGVASAPSTSGISVSSNKPETAVAETTDGVSEQHGGKARNPFLALPGAAAAAKAATGASTSGSSSSSGSKSSTSTPTTGSGGSSSTPSTGSSGSGSSPSKKKSKPKQLYAVSVKFGPVSANIAPEPQLTEYANLKLNAPLPTAKQPLIVFRGVTSKGKSASFTLVTEAILHGVGACLPSATQCQAVDLHPGASEQLEYPQENGEVDVYELKVISIEAIEASASAARRATAFAQSQPGTALLKRENLMSMPYLHYSSQPGVLAFTWHKAFASRARTSRHARRR